MFRIAFIDDSPLVSRLFKRILLTKNVLSPEDQFDIFHNADAFMEAFLLYGNTHYNMIFCEHTLHHPITVNGIEFLQKILDLGYNNPALLCSAQNNKQISIDLLINGAAVPIIAKKENVNTIDMLVKFIRRIKGV